MNRLELILAAGLAAASAAAPIPLPALTFLSAPGDAATRPERSRSMLIGVRILDEEGRPVAGARVQRHGAAGEALSDANGVAAVEGVDPDQQLELTVTADGFPAKEAKLFPPFPVISEIRLGASS